MWRGFGLKVAILGVSLACGCSKSPGRNEVARRQSNLGVSPASWPQEGPAPIEDLFRPEDFLKGDNTGAVHRLALHPTNPATVYAASVNGGVWKTTGADSVFGPTPTRPHWTTNTDFLPSLSTGALAMDALDPQHLIAGTGARSNGLPSGAEGLVYMTSNGGDSWTPVDSLLLRDRRILGLAMRGQVVIAVAVEASDDPRRGFVFRSENGGADWADILGAGGLPAQVGSAMDAVLDPSDPDRVYIVVADRGFGGSGIYLGTSNGTSWTRVSDNDSSPGGLPTILKASGVHSARLAVGPTGALFVTIVALGRPVYVGYTLDQGQHWTAMDLPSRPVTDPNVAPSTPTAIARITRGSVPGGQATTILVDAGGSHNLKNGLGSIRVRILGVPAVSGVNDLNGDWIAAPYMPPTDGGAPTASTTRFILRSRLTGDEGDGTTAPFDVSDQGMTYQAWIGTNDGMGDKNIALALDPTDSDIVYMGGDSTPIHLVRGDASTPASTAIPSGQWTTISNQDGTSDGRSVHVDIRDMVLDASGDLLYICSDGGVFVRDSPRDSKNGKWYSLAGDLMTVEFRSIALDPLSHALLGGTQDNGSPSQFQSSDGTPIPWRSIEFADGVAVAAVNAHADDPISGRPISYRYTSFQGSNDFELHKFDDTGAKLDTIYLLNPTDPTASKLVVVGNGGDGGVGDGGSAGGVVKHLNDVENIDWLAAIGVNRVYDPNANPQPNPQRWLLIAGHDKGVWESRDLGETVKLISGSPLNARSFSWGNASNVEALWVAAENGGMATIHTRFAEADPLELEPGASFPTSGQGATAVAMSASDPNVAYATADSRVFRLTHASPPVAPEDVTGDLVRLTNGPFQGAGRLRSIVYVSSATNGDRIFVAAADGGVPGVFMMTVDNPGVWTRVGTNLPNANAFALDYDPVNQMLVVGTAGRGAWSLTGVSTLDRAPKALCKNVTVSVDATCHATVSPAAFNNGSVDPDGNPLTIVAVDPSTLAPVTLPPFPLGTFPITIKASDNQGAAALCPQVFLTVIDTTPPVLHVPPARTVSTCSDAVVVSVGQATAIDNCATALVPTGQVVAKNGVPLNPPIPVVNGQVTLGPGTYTVRWTVADGSNPPVQANQTVTVGAVIEVSQTFLLDDRAELRSSTGGFAAVLNAGTGSTRVGQDCRTGGVISRAPVTVQHRAIVAGNIVSGSTVTKDADATVNGTITQNASVSLPALPTLPNFPAPTLGSFTVNAGTTQTRPPGSYASAIINGGTLILQSGDYFFQSLTINSGSIVRVQPTTRVFVRDTMVFNAPFRTSSAAVQSIFLGFRGASLSLFAVFNGTLVAPNASVVFGTGSGLTYTGSFFGRSFEVTPGSALVCSL